MRLLLIVAIIFLGCQKKQPAEATVETDTTSNPVTKEDAYEKTDTYNYTEFFGVYDHESTTKNFTAILSLRENGNDIYFTLSVSQGTCKGETEGVVMMVEKTEKYYLGFYDSESCRLQFTFNKIEKKVDV